MSDENGEMIDRIQRKLDALAEAMKEEFGPNPTDRQMIAFVMNVLAGVLVTKDMEQEQAERQLQMLMTKLKAAKP